MPARIPDVNEIETPVSQYGGPSATVTLPPGAEGASIGAQNLANEAERMNKDQLAKAKVDFQIGQMQEDAKYDDDDDIDTISERHEFGIENALTNAAGNIDDPMLREAFLQEYSVEVERSKLNMSDKVTKRMNDREIGYMENAIEEMVKGATDLTYGNPATATDAIQSSLESMVERGVISNEAAQAKLRQTQEQMAVGRLSNMAPDDRINALKQPWAKNLSPEQRRRLMDEATADARNQGTFDFASGLIAQDMPMQDALNAIRDQYPDVDDYQNALKHYTQQKQDQINASNMANEELYQELFDNIGSGQFRFDQMTDEQRETLDADMQANLLQWENKIAAEKSGSWAPRYSDPNIMNEMSRLYHSSDDPSAARYYFKKNFAKLSETDREKWDRYTRPGKSGENVYKPHISVDEQVTAMAKANNWDDEEKHYLNQLVEDEKARYFQETGKQIPAVQLREFAVTEGSKIRRYPQNKWFDGDKYLQDHSPEFQERFRQYRDAALRRQPWLRGSQIISLFEDMLLAEYRAGQTVNKVGRQREAR